ncbi:hypothetical protein ACH5RR_010384 [Cinchona calisaya]|uniref:BHLH domain-containing protein n=1 Tax=Cinchona calisaya TaxID=153742 RepID=A0ABD3AIS3_9GENT
MEKEYFLNAGIQPLVQFEVPTMQAWNTFTSAQELNCSPDHTSSSSFFNPNWEKQDDHYAQIVSSPVAPTSTLPTDAVALRELIRKLGPICNSGEVPQPFPAVINSPAKLQLPVLNENLPNLRNSVSFNPALPALSADPGFVERAAKFSCFGSRSFNGRTSHFGHNNVELPYISCAPTMGNNRKFPRVSSSPLIQQDGSPMENKNLGQPHMEMRSVNGLIPGSDKILNNLPATGANSNEESSVSEQMLSRETGSKAPNESNCRKRKAAARGKAKEDASSHSNKEVEADADTNAKQSKLTEANMEEEKGSDNKTGDDNVNQKTPEPPKDYIHVRARRGQATDSHSLAERVRREKISERMKLLQDLVPGCNKVTGKALMLDEIINYVQSLQRQVEFLSMKLASVNPRLDNIDNLLSKDVYQPNASSLPHPLFPMDSSEPVLYKNQPQRGPQLHNNGSVDHVDTTLCHNLGLHLPPLDGFTDGLPQFPPFCEDDWQSIVQMGYSQNPDREAALHSQTFPVANQASHMKIEL